MAPQLDHAAEQDADDSVAFTAAPKVGACPNLGPAAATVPDRLARYAFDRHVAGCLVGKCAVHGWLLRLLAECMVSVLLPFVSAGGRRTEPAKALLLRIIAKWAPVLGVAHYINSSSNARCLEHRRGRAGKVDVRFEPIM